MPTLSWGQKDKWSLSRRNNLHGLVLKGVVLEEPGYLEINEEVSEHSSRNINQIPWTGIFPDVFESLAETLNFSFALVPL